MMSIFGSRRDRHTTTSRRPRHAKPQVEGLEKIIALHGAGAGVGHHPHAGEVTSTGTATSTQTIEQKGATVTVNLENKGGNYKGASLVIDANTLNIAFQKAKVSGTATVEANLAVKGSKKVVPVTLEATATSSQTIEQEGATVTVNLENKGGNYKGATLVIEANTLNNAVQQVTASGTATVEGQPRGEGFQEGHSRHSRGDEHGDGNQ
jgi:hypothetical protein